MLSFVIPVKNNEVAVQELYQQISNQCDQITRSFEIIFIEHGSLDNSWPQIKKLSETYPDSVRAIQLHDGTSQSSAHRIGFHKALGDVIFTLSGNLKDDPVNIPRFLKKLDEGHDVVIGRNQNTGLGRFSPDRLLNKMVALFSGVDLNHYNSDFVCYRSEVIRSMTELSYISTQKKFPLSASVDGYKVGQVLLKDRQKSTRNRYTLLEFSTLNFLNHHPENPQGFIAGVSAVLFFSGLMFVILGQAGSVDSFILTTIGAGLVFNVIPLAVLGIVMDMQFSMLANGQDIETLSKNAIIFDTATAIDLSGTASQNSKSSESDSKVS